MFSKSHLLPAQEHNFHPVYRPDIDGLRAVAILSVVIFHAFPTALHGGFVGVDIFFVISGFLISSIIFKSLLRGDFSFPEFYAHRIKRIFPALILVLAAAFTLGWFILWPDEFAQLGHHMAAGAGFVQNFVLWKEAGYFDTASELKPLMHLWSLAVEEQFYLIYPVFIWAVWRLRLNVLAVVILFGLLSLVWNVIGVADNAVKTFFLPHTRIWELLAGAVLAYLQMFKRTLFAEWLKKRLILSAIFRLPPHAEKADANLHDMLSVIGMTLILIAVIALNRGMLFPGWWALMPVVGAWLLIYAGPHAWVNQKILSHRFMVFVGLISYPLYLWHWVLLSYLRILMSGQPLMGMRIAVVALSFLLAWLTFRLLEHPIRFGRKSWTKTAMLCGMVIIVGYIGFNAFQRGGLDARPVAKMNLYFGNVEADFSNFVEGCGLQSPEIAEKFTLCKSDKRGHVKYALVGDSKAASLAPGLMIESGNSGHWLFIGGNGKYGAPVPVMSEDPMYAKYQPLVKYALDAIVNDRDIEVVVLTTATRALFALRNADSLDDLPENGNFEIAFKGLDNFVAQLVAAGKKVVITIDNPTFKDPHLCVSRKTSLEVLNQILQLDNVSKCSISYEQHLKMSKQYRFLLDKLQLKYPDSLRIFDTLNQLCDMGNRTCSMFLEDRLLYSYSDHISAYASTRIAQKLLPFIESFSQQNRR